ncbi:laminin subunit alpha-3 [Gracilinanus agilis]|uniref:laminin subunit alpha-3 n=1 Tax=Gracilinanus agilis TaxID=191870 RepID=UPI001CFE51DA|nr:laminin subunit alpha-3 [Gracilinanus agilis]
MARVRNSTPAAAPVPRWLRRLFFLLLYPLSAAAASPEPETGFSLHPPYFNLAEAARISATATCGEEPEGARPRPELYCKLVGGPIASTTGHTIQGQFCDYCNSGDPSKAHPVTNAIDGTECWWQSPPLSLGLQYNKVNVTLDLGQLFHVAYVLIKFANSPRPDLWVLERSVDSGRTYLPWQFFAHSKIDCWEQFGTEANMPIIEDDDVICTTEYSRIVPLENGEVVVSLVNGRPGAKNFTFSPMLREFTKATNIRLRFLRTNTLLGHLISKAQRDPTVTRRYYYSIKDISIGGRCVCNGHAEVCRAKGPENLFQCECQHNTCGESCDRCCAGYNQKQWQPATAEQTNECEACNCHGHATDCYYDPDIERLKGSLNIHGVYEGGGVCINCQHNTAGVNCERCLQGYYRPYNVPVEAPHGCILCSCNPEYTDGCEQGTGRCICKLNFQGENCEHCAKGYYNFPFCQSIPIYPVFTPRPEASTTPSGIRDGCPPGFFGPQCQACQCYSIGAAPGDCDRKTGRCFCQPGFHGFSCEECAVGYFHYPFCQRCECNSVGVISEICDFHGKCLCRFGVGGPKCDSCSSGFYSFPACQECNCDPLGSQDGACGPRGQCRCYPNYAGLSCNQCAPEYYSYPSCFPCQCSPLGSYQTTCDPGTGQCECRPGITGHQCDQCLSGAYDFPHCKGSSSECNPLGTMDSSSGFCQCQLYVEGPTCSICKPLYWNLAGENPNGCSECQCDVMGTLSGVGECEQREGECYCKPHVCGDSCNACEDGYYALEDSNYFGCQGCRCDVGGSISSMCDDLSGACQCREHIMGKSCQQPEINHYFPDLHHMKFEIEDGTTPNGRGVRFGFDPTEFPDFSWRGYAQMTPVQNEVRVTLNVEKSSQYLFRAILRYINPGIETVFGHITIYQPQSKAGAVQSKEIVFLPSKEPAFVTIPGNGFADPFSLTPGTWIVSIKAEGILLDYLVLLPSDYYEASILQLPVTEPCAYWGPIEENCLLYQHLPMTSFACASACEAELFVLNGMPRTLGTRRPTPEHPVMADISGREVELHLTLSIPQVDHYVIVIEYANEDSQLYVADVLINSPSSSSAGRVNIYSCKYSFLCRSFVVDDLNRVAVYELLADARIQLKAHLAHFLLHRICIIPVGEFSTEYVKPSVHCIASYGQFVNQSSSCVLLAHDTPPTALVLDAVKGGMLPFVPQDPLPSASGFRGVILKSPQNQVTLRGRVPHLGQYVFIVHFCQPDHPTFPAQVVVEGGQQWSGSFSASFCPQVFGCRNLVIAESQTNLDMREPEFSVTVKVPDGKSLMLGQVLVVPAESYGYHMLHKKSVDKSFDFINNCGGNSFYIDPLTSSRFCKDSARSLVAFYNNGALPCDCHVMGAINPTCKPEGGQCQCRPNVIGRQCTRCQTGYYGFPFCKLCHCGRRLCDEMTGKCICPPRTVKPQCEVCEKQSFSYHPLVGCKVCNCSRIGAVSATAPECDKNNGQCRCKPRITGRQCDRCSSGFYRFPECIPCNCNQDGTEPGVCDPWTGACLCKENVEGAECNVCQKGSFYLDPSNPKGCTSCFCFGISDHCHSTNKRRAKFVDMIGWHLETADQMAIPVTFNPGSNSVVADIQELPSSVHSVYWIAPPSYLGDKGNFRHVSSNNQVSREELMMVLSRLDGLHIRGLYFTETQRLTLGEVGLEEVTSTGSGSIAYNVEICSCPPDYTGDSCQGCNPGYYRDNKGFYTGRCVPCRCNGHSNRCQDGSGTCINCQHNTAGANCERCKEGYYGDALQGSCRVCPCPHTNSFATGCVVNGVNVKCSCKPGYVGTQCERCAPGYFGNPQKFGGSCQPCNCNNNGQLTSCDPLTGDCINQEPKDGGPEECDDCDSCVTTLLKDQGTMSDELRLIKSQLQSTSANAATLEQMKHLETQTKDLRNHLLSYQSAIASRVSKVDALEKDLNSLNQDFETLQEKVQINSRKAQTLYNSVSQTSQSAKQLDTRIQSVIRDVHVLLKQISGTDGEGHTLPSGDLSRKLAEAERMMREMRSRDFREQLRKAEAEKREAQLLLNRIQSSLKNHQTENHELVKTVRDSLNEYEAKISDLRKALQEATLQTKLANGLNQANDRALEDIKRINFVNHIIIIIMRNDLSPPPVSSYLPNSCHDISPALDSLRDTLDVVTTKKGLIQTDLTTIQDDLRGINRDDIDRMTNNAKSLIRNANDVTSSVLDGLTPIQTHVERLQETYGSAQSEDFNEALSDANNSVKKLTSKIPDLLSKIESINQQLLPLGNISDNVDRIRELIQQARDAANKVAVPMRFNGKSGVEVRLPNDLEDLKGYTSLSLFLQRPESREDGGEDEDMFVMYLGNKDTSKDYIGMAVRDGKLVCVYNLGDQEAETQMDPILTKSITQEAIMDRVKFQRIFQFAKLSFFKEATSNKPKPPDFYDMDSGSGDVLLNLDPENVVFYVGGYPPNFKLPRVLKYPPYKGCIELDDLNENVLSLYNFKKTFNLNTTEVEPCRRNKEESDKNYFEGTGYARVPTQPSTPFPTFQQTIQTTVDEGLLFFAEHQDFFISLIMEKGYPVLRYKLNSEPPEEKRNRVPMNDGTDQMITIRMRKVQKLLRITVNQSVIEVQDAQIFNFNTYYLGGIPISLREKFNITTPAFRGCMKNLKKTIGVIRLNDTVGVTKKCSEDWKLVRTASLSRDGQLSFIDVGLPDPNYFQSSFGFQTFQPNGLLLRHQIGTNSLQIALEDGHIELSSREQGTILKSPQTYVDGLLHYVSIIKDDTGLRLLIDDKSLKDNQRLRIFSDSQQSLRFGGSDFEGCITNVFFQRLAQSPEVLNLVTHTRREKEKVSLGICNLNKPPFLMLLKSSAKISTSRTFNIDRLQRDMHPASLMKRKVPTVAQHCLEWPQSQASKGSYQFGDSPTSHLSYTFPEEMLKDRSHFAVDIQTTSTAPGLVVFVGSKSSFMALFFSKGRIVFLLKAEGKKLRLKTKEKLNDGKWHTIVFGHEGSKARFVIDGLKIQEGSLAGNSIFTVKPPIYVGASPQVKLKSLPKSSFIGCLRNFQLDGKALDTPFQNFGVTPCLGGPLEKGMYFSQDGGHISFDNSWMLGKEFKIIFSIRPRSLTGLLMHTGSQPGKYLSVYMEEGKVTASVDSGAGEMLTSVTPQQSLCDGHWHSVAVTLKQNLLQLDLDTDSSSETGQLPTLPGSNQQPLYLGGIPANLTTLRLPIQKPFFGCLKKVTINNVAVSVTKASEVQGAVSPNGCPVH